MSKGVPVNIHVGNSTDPSNADEVIAMIREWRFQAASRNGTAMTARGYLDFAWGDAMLSDGPMPTTDGHPRPKLKK